MDETLDVIIAGGGVAGLSAALTLGRALRRVVVVDTGQPRNRFAAHMHAALGQEGASPDSLVLKGRAEAAAYGVAFLDAAVVKLRADDHAVTVTTARRELTARALVVATGLSDDLPDVAGLAEHWGTGVFGCPYCHGWEVRNGRLGVLGSSPMSVHQAQLLRQWSDRVSFLTAGCGPIEDDLRRRLQARGVELIETPVAEVLADGRRLTGIRLTDGRVIELDGLFTAPTPRPHDEFLDSLGLERTETPHGTFLAVDATGRTSHPRIWAAGNVVDPGANVPISIGAGAITGGAVNMALVAEEFDNALSTTTSRQATEAKASPVKFWEGRYAASDRVWSGRVNTTMADVVSHLPVGDALDLGCGEGGDAVWLAEQGWQVTAVDISPTAVARGAEGAASRGVADRITWEAQDLSTWQTDKTFDLVSASFFHSTVDLPRTQILRRAAGQVRVGGHLLLVSHVFETDEDIPPWAWAGDPDTDVSHQPVLLTPSEEITELDLDPTQWSVEQRDIRRRQAIGPDGQQRATVKDGVVLLRRT